ncbi:MAG: hypothetical protein A4E70_02456 [Syntrophus sp. PtaU1.Bin005]|nr:MAG: hypothetical protein A4E70_02456 [Syntrophus sp. PtaU1.Bin005]
MCRDVQIPSALADCPLGEGNRSGELKALCRADHTGEAAPQKPADLDAGFTGKPGAEEGKVDVRPSGLELSPVRHERADWKGAVKCAVEHAVLLQPDFQRAAEPFFATQEGRIQPPHGDVPAFSSDGAPEVGPGLQGKMVPARQVKAKLPVCHTPRLRRRQPGVEAGEIQSTDAQGGVSAQAGAEEVRSGFDALPGCPGYDEGAQGHPLLSQGKGCRCGQVPRTDSVAAGKTEEVSLPPPVGITAGKL